MFLVTVSFIPIMRRVWSCRTRAHVGDCVRNADLYSGGGAVPFWRWRVCKAQKTPFFSIAVTHRPHIFYSCMSSHPKTHIFSFNLSLNAPWFEKLAFEKNTMYFTLVILQSSIEKTNHVQVIPGSIRTMLCFKYHPKTLLFCELLAVTRWPHIFLYFSLTECHKSCSHPMTPHFLSLCSHRMPQPVGGRALHPYPLHIWLPPGLYCLATLRDNPACCTSHTLIFEFSYLSSVNLDWL